MEKLLCVVFVSSLLLATLADEASFSYSSTDRQQDRILGRKGRELHLLQNEGKHEEQQKVVSMEAKKAAETTAGWMDDSDEDAKEGLIYSADYSGVAMHSRSPPKHKHPKP